jgi:hypothetical protein
MSDLDDVPVAYTQSGDYPRTPQRVPSIQSMLHPMVPPSKSIDFPFQGPSNTDVNTSMTNSTETIHTAAPLNPFAFVERKHPYVPEGVSAKAAHCGTSHGSLQVSQPIPNSHYAGVAAPLEGSKMTASAVHSRIINSEQYQYPPTTAAPGTPQYSGVTTATDYLESEGLNSAQSSSDDSSVDCMDDVTIHKQLMVDRLMVCFYDMFAFTEFTTCNGDATSSSNGSPEERAKSADWGARKGKKRKSDERQDKEQPNSEDDNDVGKRRRTKDRFAMQDLKAEKRFACPYFKRDPQRHQSSRACSGHWWPDVHRIKYDLQLTQRLMANASTGAASIALTLCRSIADAVTPRLRSKTN